MKIRIIAQKDTEEVLQEILKGVNNDSIDEMEVKREFSAAEGLASKPVTIGAIIIASAKAVAVLSTAVSAYLNYRTQQMKSAGAAAPLGSNKQGPGPTPAAVSQNSKGEVQISVAGAPPEMEAKLRESAKKAGVNMVFDME